MRRIDPVSQTLCVYGSRGGCDWEPVFTFSDSIRMFFEAPRLTMDGRLLCAARTCDGPAVLRWPADGLCRQADLIVAATGRPRMVKADWIRPGAAVIDVGVTSVDGELVGDVDHDNAIGVAALITPHRRGVGPMTITMLLRNTLEAYKTRKGIGAA